MKSLFRVPQRVHHGLLLITTLASSPGGEAQSLEQIAQHEGISQGFLEEIAGFLRTAGLIKGQRGAHGGYVLAVDAEQLTVAEVITAIEGPLAMVDCLDGVGCKLSANCTNKPVWQKIQQQLVHSMEEMTIAEIVAKPQELREPLKLQKTV